MEEENYELNKAAPSKRRNILKSKMPEGPALSPASKAALRIQKKILSAIRVEEVRKSNARKRKYLASKSITGKVIYYTAVHCT